MVIVCQHCGDKGFHDALTLCQKCGECALHRYCLEELPDDLSEDVIWFCEDCRPDISKQSTFDKASSSLSRFSVSEEVESPKTVQPSKCRSSYKKNGKIIAGSETKTEVKTYDGRSPSDDEPLCREKCDKDQKLGRKRRLILDDEDDQPLETSQVAVSISTASNMVERRVTTGSVANTEWQVCEGRPFGNDSQLREKCDNELKLRKERRLFLENEETKPSNTLGQRVHTTCTVAEVEAHICDSRTSSNKLPCREETVKDQQLKRGAEGQMCEGRPFGNDSQLREKCDNELKLGKESRLVLEDEEAKPSNTLEQRVFTTRTVAEAEVQICDGRSYSNKSTCKEESDKDKQLKRGQKTFQCSDLKPSHILQHKIIAGSMDKKTVQISDVGPCGEMPWSIEKCDNDCELTKRQRLVLSDEEGEPVKTSQVATCHLRPSNILQEKDITGSVAKTKVRTRDGRSFGSEQQSREKYDEHENLRKQRKTSKVSDPRPLNISQLKVVTGSVAKTKVHKRDGSPCSVAWYRGKCQKLGEQRKTSEVSDRIPLNILQQKAITSSVAEMKGQKYDIRPYRSEPEYRGKYYEDQKFQKKQRVLEDDKGDKPLKTSQADANDPRLSNVLEQNCYLEVRPVIDPIWKGSLSIWSKDLNSLDRLLVHAHLSNLACFKVLEVAMLLPRVISFELSNRSHIWPKSFQKLGPTYHHIALYFFPVNRRDDDIFDSLVGEMSHQDLAMRAVLKEAELLVFTSHALPMHIRRFRTKYYLWGVFRRKQA